MDGNLPAIYELCASYRVPILLHIDPPFGEPIIKLEEALREFPDTIFIFGHANVFNPPENMESILSRYTNLYMDFFAGFTAYDPSNTYPLEDYIPLIKKYSKRFLLSTDSATAQNVNYEKAINAMYEVIDLCEDVSIGERIGRLNFLEIIESQPATASQLALLRQETNPNSINKRMANELIIAHQLDIPAAPWV
ncbi:amidohydrolase family protein [Paenibacillus mendelii]|uniref:Amidohydrolase family protein n=1 Tax=Paenibacillus mendelii TaxID=206163 RepID=A0ABV6JER3_9BACL|nr:amidohydrolase family protein [Paenibacillus mendelii]MCQ6563841.1 amidohydrolase family protein [Paenibacillus mendelii]